MTEWPPTRDRETQAREWVDALIGERRASVEDGQAGFEVFDITPPDWFGERAFGGLVLGQAMGAAVQTVDAALRPHSLHGYFMRPVRSLVPVEVRVTHLRDGRSFSARQVDLCQDGKTCFWGTVSFCADEEGDEYQHALPDVPRALQIPPPPPEEAWDDEGPLDWRELGPTEQRADGSYHATRRSWVRCMATPPVPERMPNADALHACLVAYISDTTGSSFRPGSMGTWGDHTDASLDHAIWFHRPVRVHEQWLYVENDAVVNAGARATVRGTCWTESGELVWSMAQELLIRRLAHTST